LDTHPKPQNLLRKTPEVTTLHEPPQSNAYKSKKPGTGFQGHNKDVSRVYDKESGDLL
jgi:hypothetical protein